MGLRPLSDLNGPAIDRAGTRAYFYIRMSEPGTSETCCGFNELSASDGSPVMDKTVPVGRP
jgi:hypothetical protein